MAVQSMQDPVGVADPLLPGGHLNTACTTQQHPYLMGFLLLGRQAFISHAGTLHFKTAALWANLLYC